MVFVNSRSGKLTKELTSLTIMAMDKINDLVNTMYKRLAVVGTRLEEREDTD